MGKFIMFIAFIICFGWYVHHNEVHVPTIEELNVEPPKNHENNKSVTVPKQERPKSEYVRLVGKGYCDNATGEEPHYVGLTGFVVVNNMDLLTNYERKFPVQPWLVKTVKQFGPNQFQDSNTTVHHKTKVTVLKQMLWDEGNNLYSGALLVKDITTKNQYLINVVNFMTYPYWDDNIKKASQEGTLIAVYNGKGKTPVTNGNYTGLKSGTEVVVDGFDNYTNVVKAKVYKVWDLEFGGVETDFDPTSLDIKY